jgi:hypothetical protein
VQQFEVKALLSFFGNAPQVFRTFVAIAGAAGMLGPASANLDTRLAGGASPA